MDFANLLAVADRAVQVNLGGTAVVYQPQAGDAVTVTGIFDDAYLEIDNGNSGVEEVGPSVWLKLSDLPVHPESDNPVLTIHGLTYHVRGRQVDGTVGGGIRLLLQRYGA